MWAFLVIHPTANAILRSGVFPDLLESPSHRPSDAERVYVGNELISTKALRQVDVAAAASAPIGKARGVLTKPTKWFSINN